MKENMIDYSSNFNQSEDMANSIFGKNEKDPEIIDESSEDVVVDKMGKIVSSSGLVNLRRDPSTNHEPITTLKHDEEVMIISEPNDEWYEIMTSNNEEGYIMKKLIELI